MEKRYLSVKKNVPLIHANPKKVEMSYCLAPEVTKSEKILKVFANQIIDIIFSKKAERS